MLDRLKGREKLKEGRGRFPAIDMSDDTEEDRGWERTKGGDIGEWGRDTPLLEDSLRGLEKVEPAFELV